MSVFKYVDNFLRKSSGLENDLENGIRRRATDIWYIEDDVEYEKCKF